MLNFPSAWQNHNNVYLALVSHTSLQTSAKGIPKHPGTVLLWSDDSWSFSASCFFSTEKDIHFYPAQSLSPSYKNVYSIIKSKTALTCCYNTLWMWKVFWDLMWNMGKGVIWPPFHMFRLEQQITLSRFEHYSQHIHFNCFSSYYPFECC